MQTTTNSVLPLLSTASMFSPGNHEHTQGDPAHLSQQAVSCGQHFKHGLVIGVVRFNWSPGDEDGIRIHG